MHINKTEINKKIEKTAYDCTWNVSIVVVRLDVLLEPKKEL